MLYVVGRAAEGSRAPSSVPTRDADVLTRIFFESRERIVLQQWTLGSVFEERRGGPISYFPYRCELYKERVKIQLGSRRRLIIKWLLRGERGPNRKACHAPVVCEPIYIFAGADTRDISAALSLLPHCGFRQSAHT